MFPRHISKVEKPVTRIRKEDGSQQEIHGAIAPYNFVELPNKVVSAEPLPENDCYHHERHTGKIECTLTTESPLYIRCGLTPADFAEFGDKSTSVADLPQDPEKRARRTDFFQSPSATVPLIPGSSVRGMLRTLVEIISFSKITPVADNQRLFFRAVATDPKKDSLSAEYKNFVKPEVIKAGHLKKDEKGWYIKPAKTNKGVTFAWVEEPSIPQSILPDYKRLNSSSYEPRYISVSYASIHEKHNDRAKPRRIFATHVDSPDRHPQKGVLVTSGSMKQSNVPSSRRNHCLVFDCLVFEPDDDSKKLRIDPIAVQHYCNALTEFQKKAPFSKEAGILEELENRVVFYYPPEPGELVGFFGQSPNFRIPYSPNRNGHASTVADYIPDVLKDVSVMDLADTIFGFVRQPQQNNQKEKTRAGRVFISDSKYVTNEDGIWERVITPQILGSPKPTTFQHYLVQPEETGADKAKLKHYASQPPPSDSADESTSGETVIRGHKLYWHKGNISINKVRQIDQRKIEEKNTQYTEVKPIKKGVSFKFTIHFENLSDVELGALLWVLNIAQDDKYRLSLGMGKPLGMGTVKINHTLCSSDRPQRYHKLLDNQNWYTPVTKSTANFTQAFEEYILNPEHGISELDHPQEGRAFRLEDVPRIKMLLAMLSWKDAPSSDQTRYMEIERTRPPRIGTDQNEYKERPVLPTPLDILGWEDNRRIDSPQPNPKMSQPRENSSSNLAEPSVAGLSERQQEIRKAAEEANLQQESVVSAKIVKIKGKEVTIEIAAQRPKKKTKRADQWQEGQAIRIRITELRRDGTVQGFEFVEE